VAYSGPQKCLSCPPGASPLTLNDRAMDKVLGREAAPLVVPRPLAFGGVLGRRPLVPSHCADLQRVRASRGGARLVAEEGIEARWARHRAVAGDLKAGLQDLGLEMNAPDEYWLPSLNAVRVPDGIDDGAVIDHLLEEYDLEIASGLGDLEGDIWRIGCMGYSARPKNVEYVLAALEDALGQQGSKGSGTTQARSLADRREIFVCASLPSVGGMNDLRTGLSYGDVLLVPQRSPVDSRSDVDLDAAHAERRTSVAARLGGDGHRHGGGTGDRTRARRRDGCASPLPHCRRAGDAG